MSLGISSLNIFTGGGGGGSGATTFGNATLTDDDFELGVSTFTAVIVDDCNSTVVVDAMFGTVTGGGGVPFPQPRNTATAMAASKTRIRTISGARFTFSPETPDKLACNRTTDSALSHRAWAQIFRR